MARIGARVTARPVSSGFPPIARPDARVLILGSLPGRPSLAAGEYYAHPRNAFWPILGALCGFDPQAPYARRRDALLSARVALWDVLARGARPGSLDADIVAASIVPNAFEPFFAGHPRLLRVVFNGAAAERLFVRHVRPALAARLPETVRAPSTSPAHAAMAFADKLAAWRGALGPGLRARGGRR